MQQLHGGGPTMGAASAGGSQTLDLPLGLTGSCLEAAASAHGVTRDAAVTPCGFAGLCEAGVHFVTRDFFSNSISAGRRLPEEPYYVSLHSRHASPGQPRMTHAPGDAGDGRGAARLTGEDKGQEEQGGERAAGGKEEGKDGGHRGREEEGEGEVEEGRPGKRRRAAVAVPKGVRVPPPEEVCLPGQAWGEGARWIEPWDEAAALESWAMVMNHWHHWGRE